MRMIPLISALQPLLLLTGCAYALRTGNPPSHQKLSLHTTSPTNYLVRVADTNDFPVAADGRVTIDVPTLPRGCDTYALGFIKISDGSPERIRAIHILKDGKIVRKLSLEKLKQLPVDTEQYHILNLR
ncbi:MAG TPA: hypothetical protein VGH19_14655 [Verrucomicrobiae bacterium]